MRHRLRRRLHPLRQLSFERRAAREGYHLIAGLDEAGRGPLAGPVVAAAAVVRDSRFSCRIDDSKRLSPRQREEAFFEILEKCWIGVGVVTVELIEVLNIFQASRLAMEQALQNLSISPDFLLVDGRLPLQVSQPYWQIIHGDQRSFSISCASIVAKVTRDRIMSCYHALYPHYGFIHHKGYGTPEHLEALKRHGPSPIHRQGFHPICEMTSDADHP